MEEKIDGRRQRRIDRINRIIDQTAREIRGTGNWQPATHQIAALEGCCVRTVFALFGSRERLLRAVYARHQQALLVTLRAQFQGLAGTDVALQRNLIEALMGIGMPGVPTAIWTAVAQESIEAENAK